MKIKIILVRAHSDSVAILDSSEACTVLDLETNPDIALEQIRLCFEKNWDAKVHALQWLSPDDFGIATDDRTPCLVLHADALGRIPTRPADSEREPASVTVLGFPEQLLKEAVRHHETEPWTQPGWFANTSHWILSWFGTDAIQSIDQVRVSSTGAVLKIIGQGATYFLKTVPPMFDYEPRLLTILDRNVPGACPSVLPTQPDRCTHLTLGITGSSLLTTQDAGEWCAAIQDLAIVQRRAVAYTKEIRAAGVPYQSMADFSLGVGEMVENLLIMQQGAPNQLSPGELQRLSCLSKVARDSCDTLQECGLPDTVVHGDLNRSNIYRTSLGRTSFIDWTICRIGHPFFALGFLLFAAQESNHPMNGRVEELKSAYLVPWRDYTSMDRLLAGLDAAAGLFWLDTAQVVAKFTQQNKRDLPGARAEVAAMLRKCLTAFDSRKQ